MRRRNRSERGEGQIGCLFGVVLLLIGALIAYRMVPVKVNVAELRDTVHDEAKSAGTHPDRQIMETILAKAEDLNLPITEENVTIVRKSGNIRIEVDYSVPVEFPGYTYNWHFNHVAENPIF